MKKIYLRSGVVFMFIAVIIIFNGRTVFAQYNQIELKDTVQQKKVYPYILPFFGGKVYQKGVKLPLPWGIMLNNFYAKQGVVLENLHAGFKSEGTNVPLTDLDRIVNFNKIEASALSINVRPDVWILPFLNVYGIFGSTFTNTEVVMDYPINLHTLVKTNGFTYGFGTSGAFGFGPVFMVLDGNWSWTNLENLKQPVRSNVFSFRIGHNILFKKSKKDAGIAFWVGAMRVRTGGVSNGQIKINEVFPNSEEEINRIVDEYWNWYDGLGPLDPKKVIADRVFTPIIDNLEKGAGTGEILYSFEKRPVEEWNFLIGGQYQIDPRWQLRFEAGFLGDRTQGLLSFNYRFGIKRKSVN